MEKNRIHGYGEDKHLSTVLIAASSCDVIIGIFCYIICLSFVFPSGEVPHCFSEPFPYCTFNSCTCRFRSHWHLHGLGSYAQRCKTTFDWTGDWNRLRNSHCFFSRQAQCNYTITCLVRVGKMLWELLDHTRPCFFAGRCCYWKNSGTRSWCLRHSGRVQSVWHGSRWHTRRDDNVSDSKQHVGRIGMARQKCKQINELRRKLNWIDLSWSNRMFVLINRYILCCDFRTRFSTSTQWYIITYNLWFSPLLDSPWISTRPVLTFL